MTNTNQKPAKHTPGPWVVSEDYNVFASNPAGNLYKWPIAETRRGPMTTLYEVQANAQLIAAAPVMYELIEDALRQAKAISLNADSLAVNTNASLKTNLIQLLEHAIAKAKGEA